MVLGESFKWIHLAVGHPIFYTAERDGSQISVQYTLDGRANYFHLMAGREYNRDNLLLMNIGTDLETTCQATHPVNVIAGLCMAAHQRLSLQSCV